MTAAAGGRVEPSEEIHEVSSASCKELQQGCVLRALYAFPDPVPAKNESHISVMLHRLFRHQHFSLWPPESLVTIHPVLFQSLSFVSYPIK